MTAGRFALVHICITWDCADVVLEMNEAPGRMTATKTENTNI